jgi:acetylornithine deacetylase/succinyl-diaminopimelate desuccinylase-like protein
MTRSRIEDLRSLIDRKRLLDTAWRLIEVRSRTGEAGAVSERLAEILSAEGFAVERPTGGHVAAPAVVVRLRASQPGPILQFDGHLDVVHLPFVPPRVEGGRLTGSGSCDMKSGVAASVEALRCIRDSGELSAGEILLTAHDLHEAPWGDGSQLDQLIRAGIKGDGVLIPEPLCDVLPIAGRGCATWMTEIGRAGAPVHEVMRPHAEPSVIAAAAELIQRLGRLEQELGCTRHPVCGAASVFVGQVHSGEIYNQYPQAAWMEGTRRWLPGTSGRAVEEDFRGRLSALAAETGTSVNCNWQFIRDAFFLDTGHPLVGAFQRCHEAVAGAPLPTGPKPFVDDGNSFSALGGIPAITHGPRAGGQHTISEWVEIDDLERLATLYAATALEFCNPL